MEHTHHGLRYLPPLLRLAFPIAMQHMLMTLLNLADTVMVGQLGEVQIAAIALGNQIFFLLVLFLFGVGSGGAVFTAQFWGRRDIQGIHKALGLSLIVSGVGALIFMGLSIFMPPVLLSVFTTDAAVISEGTRYLRIVAFSYLFTAISIVYAHGLRSIGNSTLPLKATAISISLNVVGNYVLIFGVFGFPALGVAGAAIATVIARLVEVAIILGSTYLQKSPVAATVRELVTFDLPFVRRFFGRAMPVILNEIFWSLGFTMYTVVFGRMGTGHLAAYNIADTVGRLIVVFFIGTAQAAAILIGNSIGANSTSTATDRFSEAHHMGKSLIVVMPLAAIVLGVFIYAFAPLVPRLFAISPAVQEMVVALLRTLAVVLSAKIINMHIIVGILRGGGDTRYSLFIDVTFLWLIGVPAAFITGLVLQLPVHMVYLAIGLEEVAKLAAGVPRVISGKWIHVLTDPVEVLHVPVPDVADGDGF